MGRSRTYGLAKARQFPCKIVRNGDRGMVTKAELFRYLDLQMPGSATPADDAPSADLRSVS